MEVWRFGRRELYRERGCRDILQAYCQHMKGAGRDTYIDIVKWVLNKEVRMIRSSPRPVASAWP